MPKAPIIAISVFSMPAAVGLLIAREWVAAAVAIAIAVVFDLLLVRALVSETGARRQT